MLFVLNSAAIQIVGNGSDTSIDIALSSVPAGYWSAGKPSNEAQAIYGSVSATGSPSVSVTSASLNTGNILHVDFNTAPHNGSIYTINASLLFPSS